MFFGCCNQPIEQLLLPPTHQSNYLHLYNEVLQHWLKKKIFLEISICLKFGENYFVNFQKFYFSRQKNDPSLRGHNSGSRPLTEKVKSSNELPIIWPFKLITSILLYFFFFYLFGHLIDCLKLCESSNFKFKW
jgi:hypothetical protein